jgi:TatD DNase family protein
LLTLIDAHIHLDQYSDKDIDEIIRKYQALECLISVSTNLESSIRNQRLSQKYKKVYAAFGLHPEHELPSSEDLQQLFSWIAQNKDSMVAVGEVGLPYYARKKRPYDFSLEPYVVVLERFIQLAKEWKKPIILHAVYEDAPIVCDLLEKHSITKAHFHWFKGDAKTLYRMMLNGYKISVTPDVLYEEEIQKLVIDYPLEHLMVETDGPWPFEGPLQNQITHPWMIEESIKVISTLKNLPIKRVYEQLLNNTRSFYSLPN